MYGCMVHGCRGGLCVGGLGFTTAVNKVSLQLFFPLYTVAVSYFTLAAVSIVLPLSSCFVHGRGLLQCPHQVPLIVSSSLMAENTPP